VGDSRRNTDQLPLKQAALEWLLRRLLERQYLAGFDSPHNHAKAARMAGLRDFPLFSSD
jgi:hypothetical protein